jgi:hypothetical protein
MHQSFGVAHSYLFRDQRLGLKQESADQEGETEEELQVRIAEIRHGSITSILLARISSYSMN